MITFRLHHVDARCPARRGRLETAHGSVDTPAFMPVGTQGTVKGLTVDMLHATGTQMVLGNTYHLALRPGEDVVQRLGGLHAFMGWPGPILTDSGGFQVFSLAQRAEVSEDGVRFRSHIDGRPMHLTPERAVDIQQKLGSDIAMVLDQVVPLPAPRGQVEEACRRSVRWAERCCAAADHPYQVLFAIVQGGLDLSLRRWCAAELTAMDFPGYAVGGLSVGEDAGDRRRVLEATCPALPNDRPRYLMGVGTPADLLESIQLGIDLFDCVIPTRNGRNALAYTDEGPVRLRNRCHEMDARPLDPDCPCPACRHSRAYLRHLFMAKEMLGPVLLTAHNVTFYQRLLAGARRAIEEDRFEAFRRATLDRWAEASGTTRS